MKKEGVRRIREAWMKREKGGKRVNEWKDKRKSTVISKLRKILSSVVSSQNALQTVVGVMNWSPYFRSAHNARYR